MDSSRLAAFPVFADLPAAELDEVAAAMREVEVDAGSRVTAVDDSGTALYFVEEGEAEVQSEGGEATQALGPRDSFGEISLLLTGERTATVVSRTPMRMLTLSDQDSSASVHEFPSSKASFAASAPSAPVGSRLCSQGQDAGLRRRVGSHLSGSLRHL